MKVRFWSILAIFILSGCDTSRVYEENSDLKTRVWLARDVKTFEFTVPDSDKAYNIFFNVRNTMNYPHYNLYISYKIKDSTNTILEKSLENFNLFDPKSGEPLGQSGLGHIFDHKLTLLENYSFKSPGKKTLELQQFMRYDSLPEIVSAGMRIEFSEK